MSLLDLFRRSAPKPTNIDSGIDWSTRFRVNAYCEGHADWYADSGLVEINPDFPQFGPLFRNVCARMPAQWWLKSITHVAGEQHEAAFSFRGSGDVRLAFTTFDRGFRFILDSTRELDESRVRQFLSDLNTVLGETDGFRGTTWYTNEQITYACADSDSLLGGSRGPFDT
jgi:hypothetical protein